VTAQLSLPFNRATRERDLALERIERVTSETFRERAAAHIVATLRRRGASSGEVLVMECKAAWIVPTDDRHFGQPFQALSRRGLIRCVGYCNRSRGHRTSGGRLWELVSPAR